MQQVTKQHPHLRLIFSKTLEDKTAMSSSYEVRECESWEQMEMFSSELKQDLIIFAQPKDAIFEYLLKAIDKNSIKWILDIRETPFLAFEDMSRDKFFELLSLHNIQYINIHSFMRQVSAHSVSQFFDLFYTGCLKSAVSALRENVQPAIENGPTLVFTDCDPARDELATKFTRSLTKSEIKYSPYICELS